MNNCTNPATNSTTAQLVPENDTQELWTLQGRVDALHDWLLKEIHDNLESDFIKEALDNDMKIICSIMGFWDLYAIKKEPKEADNG